MVPKVLSYLSLWSSVGTGKREYSERGCLSPKNTQKGSQYTGYNLVIFAEK